jgi:hypothetical protein
MSSGRRCFAERTAPGYSRANATQGRRANPMLDRRANIIARLEKQKLLLNDTN